MIQKKRDPAPRNRFGLTGGDIALLLILILFLGGSLFVVYLRRKSKSALDSPPQTITSVAVSVGTITDLSIVPTTPAITQPSSEIIKEPISTPTEQAIISPTNTATPIPTSSPTPIEPISLPSATRILSTATPEEDTFLAESPTVIARADTPTPTLTPIPTATVTPVSTSTATPISTSTSTPTPTIILTQSPTSTVLPSVLPGELAKLVFVQSDGLNHSLGLVNSNGEIVKRDMHLYAAAPAWAPTGNVLAFFGKPGINRLGGGYAAGEGIWIIDLQTEGVEQLFPTDHVKNLAWSPDGTKLAYEYGPPDNPHQIILFDLNEGQPMSSFPGEQPAWSADSEKLVVKACPQGRSCGLWLVNLDGSDELQLSFHDSDSYPTMSPTGDLAFSSRRDGDWEIYLLQPGSSSPRRLTNRPGTDITPVFGPKGREIYLRTDSFGGWRITAINLDGNDERTIVEGIGPSDEWGLARPSVQLSSEAK